MAPTVRSIRERLLDLCDHSDPDECWPWTSGIARGTPIFSLSGAAFRHPGNRHGSTSRSARRMMWEEFNGPIPNDMFVLAGPMCDNLCVNPAHLVLGTRAEVAVRQAAARARVVPLSTHCRRGHEWTLENTHIDSRGRRTCRACRRERYYRNRFG